MDKLFVEKMNLFELKKESIECAEITFDEFIGQGVIRSQCQFADPVWYTTDEYENIGIHFTFNEDTYDEYYRDYFLIYGRRFADKAHELFGSRG